MKKILFFSVVAVGIFISPVFTFARTIYLDGGGTVNGTSTISWTTASNVWIAGDPGNPGNSIQSSTVSIPASSTIWATFLQPTISTSTFGTLLSVNPENFTMQANEQFWNDCYRGTGNVTSTIYDGIYTAWSVEMVQQGSTVCTNTNTLAIGTQVGFVGLYAFGSGGLDGFLQDVGIHNNNFGIHNIAGLQLWFQIADSPYTNTSNPVTANFIFPSQSSTIPDFSNWVLNLSNLATSSVYYLRVSYQNSTAFNFVQNIFTDYSSLITANNPNITWSFPKLHTLFDYANNNGSTSQWIAQIDFATTSNGFNNNVSSDVVFTISPFTTSTYNATGTDLAGPFFWTPNQVFTGPTQQYQNPLDQTVCPSASGISDIPGAIISGICYGWNFVSSKAQQAGTNVVNFIWLRMEGIFPFSVPVMTYNAIQENASTTLSTTTMPVIEITMPYTLWQTSTSSRTLVIWDSSWDPFVAAPELKDDWFLFQSYLLTFGFIVLVYTTIRHE